MRKYSPQLFFILILSFLVSMLPQTMFSQRSAAELISVMPPPQGDIKYRDGVRQITIRDHYLFATNFWAGLQVVDISDIRNPIQTAFLPCDDEAYFTHIEGDYAYLANHGAGVQIYDITDMNNIYKKAKIQPPGNAFCVVTEFPNMYVALGDEGFVIMDISDFNNPISIKLEIPGEWIQHLYKKDNLLYLAAKKGGLIIYDVSDLENPQKLSQYQTGYNAMMVQVIDKVAFVADGPGGMVTIDVENPQFPVKLKRFSDVGFVGSLYKAGNYVYLANREVGLQIINVSDPAKPFLESRYDTNDINYGVYKKDIYVFLAANVATLIMRHNNAPQLDDITDTELLENVPFTLQLKAYEPDGDAIVYEAKNLPEGTTFDPQAGTLSWTPDYEQSGVYSKVVFRVVEQTATLLSAADTIALIVKHVNRLPDLPSLENKTVNENAVLSITIPEGSDPDKEDQNRITYRAEKLPPGATFDPATRTFSWIPTYEQSGTYVVDFLIDDGAGGIDREPLTITIIHVDRKPTLTPIARQSVEEGKTITVTIAGGELDKEDQDKISFQIENLPEGATFDPATKTVSWTPTYEQSGAYSTVKVIMVAGSLSDTTTLVINVNHVNRPPVLDAISDQTAAENQTLTFTISGSDPDAEDEGELKYTAENLPSGAMFNPETRTFIWTPSFEQSGQYSEVSFTITDPSGLSDTKKITIITAHVNRKPQITGVEDNSASENKPVEFQLSGIDPDGEDTGKLTYAAIGLPEDATLDPTTGKFSWTPGFDQSGEYNVSFVISDGDYSDTTAMTFSVAHVNRPPSLDAIEPQVVDENQPLTFSVTGSDADSEDEGLLTFSVQNLPEGAIFDPATRTVIWTPSFEQSGQHELTFTITDPSGLVDQKTLMITVNHVDRAPSLEAVTAQTVDENQPLTIQLLGSDPDREDAGKLVYEVVNLPEGAQIDPASGLITWTPDYEQSGEYTFNVLVKDPSGLSAEQSFTLTVNHVNRPPEFEVLPAQAGSENAPLQFAVRAVDADQEDAGKLVYTSANLPPGATLNETNGEVIWTPTYEQSSTYTVNFQVIDSYGATVSQEVTITIAHVNRSPELPPVTGATFRENSPGTLTIIEGQDPDQEDAEKLTYEITNLPEGAAFDAVSRTLNWTPTFEQSGEYQLIATIKDPDGLTASQTFNISVEHVNRPPQVEVMVKQTGQENSPLQFDLQAADPDREDAGKLNFQSGDLPQEAILDAASGKFSWTPTFEQSGTYQVTFEVNDSYGEAATGSVEIEIAHVNRVPTLPDVQSYQFQEENAAQYNLPKGNDPDAEDTGKLSYEMENLPNGASFDPTTGTLTWKPNFDQAGTYTITYIIKDPSGLTARKQVTLNVENINRPPVMQGLSAQDGEENKTLRFTLKAVEPDKEDEGKLVFSADNLPDGIRLNASTGEFSWTPNFDQSGTYNLRFEVRDSYNESSSTEVVINIANANRSPQIQVPGNQSVKEGETLRFKVSASDPDKEDSGELQIEAKNMPDGANFNSGSNEFTWTPGKDQQGGYNVEFIVKDAAGQTDKATVSIQVIDVPEEPQNQ
jgi:hypothetical protein